MAGTTYEFTHDDGMMLYLTNGSGTITAINSPGATAADTSYFTVPTTGTYSFEAIYAEVNGGPAVLNSDITSSATPEPSSLCSSALGFSVWHSRCFARTSRPAWSCTRSQPVPSVPVIERARKRAHFFISPRSAPLDHTRPSSSIVSQLALQLW